MKRKIEDFFLRIRVTEEDMPTTESNNTEKIPDIHIEGDIGLFEDEKEKIIQGAKQLVALGKADDMVDAIITWAVMFRGLRFSETKKTEDGKTVVVLREIAQQKTIISNEIEDR